MILRAHVDLGTTGVKLAAAIHSVKGKDLLPYDDPHWMGGIGMIGTKPCMKPPCIATCY